MIVAHRGKTFRRKIERKKMGRGVDVGYNYCSGGKKLAVPHKVVPGDFEEIDG